MEFKIDTKNSYTLLTPVTNAINANLTGAISQKMEELGQSVSSNLILDCCNCSKIEDSAFEALKQLHEDFYSSSCSLVFINLQPRILEAFRINNEGIDINIAPTLVEAIDIVNMEILERDLLNEE